MPSRFNHCPAVLVEDSEHNVNLTTPSKLLTIGVSINCVSSYQYFESTVALRPNQLDQGRRDSTKFSSHEVVHIVITATSYTHVIVAPAHLQRCLLLGFLAGGRLALGLLLLQLGGVEGVCALLHLLQGGHLQVVSAKNLNKVNL